MVPMVFTVSSPLEVSQAAVSESCALGTTASATVTITNRAAAAVAWTGVASASWIVASPASGASLAAGASATVSLTLGAGLSYEATYQGAVALADNGLPSEVAVTFQLVTRAVTGQSTLYRGPFHLFKPRGQKIYRNLGVERPRRRSYGIIRNSVCPRHNE